MSEKEYYERYGLEDASSYIEKHILNNPEELNRFDTVIKELSSSLKNGESLLDVGCGNGVFLKLLRDLYPSKDLVGLERSLAMSKASREKFDLNIVQGGAEQLPFENNNFDIVCALEVLEHLPKKCFSQTLLELERVAKKTILITVPYREIRRFVCCPECNCRFSPIYHLRTFDRRNLENLFKNYKLDRIKFIYKKLPIQYSLSTRIKNILGSHAFPETTICPACGYEKSCSNALVPDNDKYQKKTGVNSLKKMIKLLPKLLPEIHYVIWSIAVYSPVIDAPKAISL